MSRKYPNRCFFQVIFVHCMTNMLLLDWNPNREDVYIEICQEYYICSGADFSQLCGWYTAGCKKFVYYANHIFSPYLVDFYPILKKLLNRPLKILAGLIWAAGISILLANILGITGIITIIDSKISFVQDYVSPISLNLKVKTYLLIACVVYTAVFVGSITLNYTIAFDEYLKKKKMNKKQKQHASNKEVVLERG